MKEKFIEYCEGKVIKGNYPLYFKEDDDERQEVEYLLTIMYGNKPHYLFTPEEDVIIAVDKQFLDDQLHYAGDNGFVVLDLDKKTDKYFKLSQMFSLEGEVEELQFLNIAEDYYNILVNYFEEWAEEYE